MSEYTNQTEENKNLFDFVDLTDLPAELQSKLSRDSDESVKQWANIVKMANERGITELSINQIIAVASRLGYEMPSQQTVRNYLNRAVELRLISKPTRMSYGSADAVTADAAPDEEDTKDDLDDLLNS